VPLPRMRHHSGRMAPLLTGIAVPQALSRTAQVQASLSRSGAQAHACPTDPTLPDHDGGAMASTQPASVHVRSTTAEVVEAIGMRVLRIAEDMASGSRHQGRSERLIEQAEQAAIDLRAAVRGR
jgi:hypothetical protein